MLTILETINLIAANNQLLDQAVLDGRWDRVKRIEADNAECRKHIEAIERLGLEK